MKGRPDAVGCELATQPTPHRGNERMYGLRGLSLAFDLALLVVTRARGDFHIHNGRNVMPLEGDAVRVRRDLFL